jgi:hypothetical protein
MNSPRWLHTATLLPSGRVLVVGGFVDQSNAIASAEHYDPTDEVWVAAEDAIHAVAGHTATLLPSGKVLIAGGLGPSGTSPLAQLYDPDSEEWSPGGEMARARYCHTATLLHSGKVLVTGGYDGTWMTAEAEIYDPATNSWSSTNSTAVAHAGHTATLLTSGKVLVAGSADGPNPTFSAEVYDPASGTWSPTTGMFDHRRFHSATLLPSGKVLVVGGDSPTGGDLRTMEIYDPAMNAFFQAGSLYTERGRHAATLLASGRVLIVGGRYYSGALNCEQFDEGRGFAEAWRPQLAWIDPVLHLNGSFQALGTGLRGVADGGSQSNAPVVVFRSLESGMTGHATIDVSRGWAGTRFSGFGAGWLPDGYAFATVVANGIPSASAIVRIQGPGVSLSASTTTTFLGQSVSFTAKVWPPDASGWVKFFDGSTPLGTVAVSGGAADFSTSSLAEGMHSVTALYSGSNSSATSLPLAVNVARPTVHVEANHSSIGEGETVTFTVTRSGPTTSQATVGYGTVANTAAATSDFAPAFGEITFDEGETSKELSIHAYDDANVEGPESFLMAVWLQDGAENQIPAIRTSVVTIRDAEVATTFDFGASAYTVTEGGSVAVTVHRPYGSGVVAVAWKLEANTAGANEFSPATGTLTFIETEVTKTIVITATQDTAVEGVESARLSLSVVTPGTRLGRNRAAVLTVADDEGIDASGFSIGPVTPIHPEAGPSFFNLAITRPTSDTVQSVTVSTGNGTATAGSDYVGIRNQVLTFGVGDTSKSVVIPILDDSASPVDEGLEYFNVTLSNPTGGATLAHDRRATVLIRDDDYAGVVGFSSAMYWVDEEAGAISVTLVREEGTSGTISVAYSTSNLAAMAPGDYGAVANGVATFPNGKSVATITIPIVDDPTSEGSESFNLTLSNPTGGAALGPNYRSVVVIRDGE